MTNVRGCDDEPSVSPVDILPLHSTGWNAAEHAFDAEIFVDIQPMHSLAIADDCIILALSRSGLAQAPRPCQWNADDSPVDQMESDQIVRNRYVFYPSIGLSRSTHSKPDEMSEKSAFRVRSASPESERSLGHRSFSLQTPLDVGVCGIDQGAQSCGVDVGARL